MTDTRCPETTRHTPLYRTGDVGIQCRYTKGHHGQHCGSSFGTGDVFWETPAPAPGDEAITAAAAELAEVISSAQIVIGLKDRLAHAARQLETAAEDAVAAAGQAKVTAVISGKYPGQGGAP